MESFQCSYYILILTSQKFSNFGSKLPTSFFQFHFDLSAIKVSNCPFQLHVSPRNNAIRLPLTGNGPEIENFKRTVTIFWLGDETVKRIWHLRFKLKWLILFIHGPWSVPVPGRCLSGRLYREAWSHWRHPLP